ncbi:MAG: homoserine kinase [Pseudomonadota bacterium]
MNAVTQLEPQTMEATLANYAIGDLQRYWPAANGIENSNYFVQAIKDKSRQEYVLTIMEQAANAADAYVPMMDTLEAGGLPVAPPLRNRANQAIDEVAGKPAMLQRRLPGQHTYNPTIRQISALGRFIARMHQTMHQAPVSLPQHPRDLHWLKERKDMVNGYLAYADQALINDSVNRIASLLARTDVQNLPQGMIHGDLFRDNVLFNEHGLSGVLDFHHAAQGWYIYDLAVAANDWCNDAGGGLDPERTLQLLRAYHQIRPLTSAELWFFSSFALYAGVSFWLSRLAVALSRDNAGLVRFKNPDEFRTIVQHHHRHAFYFDERQLTL